MVTDCVSTFQSLLEPGFILAPLFDNQARQLRDESRQFFDVKYKAHRDNFVDAVQAWFRAWGEDPLNKRFGNDWSTLVKDLLFNETGNLTYKPHVSTNPLEYVDMLTYRSVLSALG